MASLIAREKIKLFNTVQWWSVRRKVKRTKSIKIPVKIVFIDEKMPHTGEKASLDRCE